MLGLGLSIPQAGVRSGAPSGPAYQANFLAMTSTADLTAAGITVSSPSLGGLVTDATGKLTYKPNNLLLNTATLSTQSITLPTNATNYIISIKGTGSVTLSGAATGTLNGTGASNRVSLAFTATAGGSLTVTVSGSVTSARLSAVTYEAAFRSVDDYDSTASAYYGPAFDHDSAGNPLGLRVWESRSNLALYSQSLLNGWNAALPNATLTDNVTTAPSGATTAGQLTENTSASYHGAIQVRSDASNTYTFSVYLKQGTRRYAMVWIYSSGTVKGVLFDLSNGAFISNADNSNPVASYSSQSVGNGWYRYIVTGTAALTQIGIALSDSATPTYTATRLPTYTGDGASYIYAWGFQLEQASFAGPYIPTGSAAVVAAADTPGTNSPLTGYLASKASILKYTDHSGTLHTQNFAAGAFTWPTDAWVQTLTVP